MIRLSVPAKTFLVGEYVALSGGPALLLNTLPRFELRARRKEEDVPLRMGISSAGPVAEFLQNPFFNDWDLQFLDPMSGAGGFGSSSAQFLLLFAFFRTQQNLPISETALISEYLRCNKQAGIKPSGYDLMAQMVGGVSYIHRNQDQVERNPWPFKDLDFIVVRTGVKLATHEHLASISESDIDDRLKCASDKTVQAFKKGDALKFVEGLREFSDLLSEQGWVAEHSQQILKRLGKRTLVAKGCGAMGADVVIGVGTNQEIVKLTEEMKSEGFHVVATKRDLSMMGIEKFKAPEKEWSEGPHL